MMSTTTTYSEALQVMAEKYREAGQKWPASAQEMAQWAYRKGLWEPREKDVVGQLAQDISRALREEQYTDLQGRKVRTKHAARRLHDPLGDDDESGPKIQTMLWADIRCDDADHIVTALQQRRMQIVGACEQLKTDADSFNENHASGRTIQLVFNFEDDLAEMDQPTEYCPSSPA